MNALTQRPFQLVVLVIFGLLAVTGVFVFANYSGISGSGPKIGSVVIWGTLPSAAITQEIGTISNLDKSFSKVSYVQEPAATFDSTLSDAIASGNGPDLILISQEQLVSEENKINVIPFSAIPERTYLDTYLPEFQLFLTSTGTYGLPFVLDPMVLYYNSSLLSQGGVAVPPHSWEAVTGLAPTLTKQNPDHSIAQSTIAFGTYDNIENARGILSLLFFQAGSPITSSSNLGIKSVLLQASTAGAASPAISALNFFTQFSDSTRTVYSWNASFPSARQAFLAGSLVFYPGFASEEPMIKASNPNLNFDMTQIPQPQTATTNVDYGVAYAFAIPKASHNPNGAYLAASALSGKDQLPAVSQALSMAPSNRTLLVATPTDLYAPVFYPEALVASGWLSPSPATTDSIFSAMISNITSGRYQSQDALSQADQAMDAALPTAQ